MTAYRVAVYSPLLRWLAAGLQLAYSWFTTGLQLATAGLQLVYSWFTAGIQLVYSWFKPGRAPGRLAADLHMIYT